MSKCGAQSLDLNRESGRTFELVSHFYPECKIDNFTHVSDSLQFYFTVKTLYHQFNGPRVLDYGAGRGAWTDEQKSTSIRELQDLRLRASEVIAADIDPAVLQNKCSNRQIVLEANRPLPFENGSFDIIVADYVFEHIQNPHAVVSELLRVLRPGGWIAARTPSRYSYVALAAQIIPNRFHSQLLRSIQPARNSIDVFPTTYKMNSFREIRRYFAGNHVTMWSTTSEPCYHFNRKTIFGILRFLHAFLPGQTLCIFVQKPSS